MVSPPRSSREKKGVATDLECTGIGIGMGIGSNKPTPSFKQIKRNKKDRSG